jgi:methylmalonyl-CoA/ethylmalonyl-CoA epimerase
MAKLRHIAVTVPDLEEGARFYEETFGMRRVGGSDIAIMLTDGTVSLAILKFKTDEQAGDERGKEFHGIHHFGFVVDDLDAADAVIAKNGGQYHMGMPGAKAAAMERKYRDPNGVVFDIVEQGYASRAWFGKAE